MRASTITGYLSGRIDAGAVKSATAKEVDDWKLRLQQKGGVAPVHLIDDIAPFTVLREHALRLVEDFLGEKLPSETLSYLFDAISMHEKFGFESESIRDFLEGLSDPETGLAVGRDRAKSLADDFRSVS